MKPFANRYISSQGARFEFPTAVTLPPGSQATVVNLGTAYAPILQFGLPAGLEGNVVSPETLVVRGNLVLDGYLVSGKADIATGFAGGPRVSQGGWDVAASTHVLDWAALAGNCDEVTGFLTVHASAKDGSKKNGIATLTLVKNAGDPPDALVTSLHASAPLATFDVALQDGNVVVHTDEECAVCWTFVAAA